MNTGGLAPPAFPVLFEDEFLRALDKPSGLSVLKDNAGQDCLADLYPALFGEKPFFVHRLDKGTSGVLLVARTPETQSLVGKTFDNRQVEKTYLALVEGCPSPGKGRIDAPLTAGRKGRQRIAEPGQGKKALTSYEVLWTDENLSLLECRPETGRTHQIRVHLASVGCPLLSDPLYGTVKGKPSENPHLTLHAWRISLKHPATGNPLRIESPIPSWAQPFL